MRKKTFTFNTHTQKTIQWTFFVICCDKNVLTKNGRPAEKKIHRSGMATIQRACMATTHFSTVNITALASALALASAVSVLFSHYNVQVYLRFNRDLQRPRCHERTLQCAEMPFKSILRTLQSVQYAFNGENHVSQAESIDIFYKSFRFFRIQKKNFL